MAEHNGDTHPELFLIDGNSLAYRAFFALPESIATSDGRPTNAIFGFASMLVKLIDRPRHVADGRRLGRRLERPQGGLRRVQGAARARARPAARAVADARAAGRGVRLHEPPGRRLRGRRRDRLAGRAGRASAGIPVMIVTGDRDAFQLIGDGIRVMATSRGITETKVYDRQAVIDRYGIPPELDPRLLRPEGRHVGQHPGRPGDRRQDGVATCCSGSATSRACSARSTRSPAPSASRT